MAMTRTNAARLTVATVTVMGGWAFAGQQALRQAQPVRQQSNQSSVTKEQFEKWMTELSNWGRWGKDDERGALNLITTAKRQQAAALVKTGTSVSLARPIRRSDKPGPLGTSGGFTNQFLIQEGYVLERQQVDYHGGTLSHFDALCHVSWNGKNYNGFTFADIATPGGGCRKLTVTTAKDGIVTRGLFLDLPNTRVKPEDIAAWEKKTGLRISPGDALLLRTKKPGSPETDGGYEPSLIPLLKQRDVALLGADHPQEGGTIPGVFLPIHTFALVALGVNLLDNLALDDLAATAERLKRWEFMLVVELLPAENGAGAPVNPVAVF
jgi:kynurenine formamidase